MKPIHILVGEDDENIRTGLIDILESENYRVTAAENGTRVLDCFQAEKIDLILLDIMMPKKSGYDVLREIRLKNQHVPIIMLTAKGEEIDKVVGLTLGADDYVVKPFGLNELLARITAVLRRAKPHHDEKKPRKELPDQFVLGEARIDARKYRVQLDDQGFDLSARELKLLYFFYCHPNEVLSRDQLLNHGWGIDYYGTTRTLDQHIANLRKKIEKNPATPAVITTVHGVGYRYQRP